MTGSPVAERAERTKAYGEGYQPTLVDRFGVWLSARQIHRYVPGFAGKRVGDFGCGYHAAFMRSVLDRVESAVLSDVSLAPDLIAHPKVNALCGPMPDALGLLESESLDIVMC